MIEQAISRIKKDQQNILESFVDSPCGTIDQYKQRLGEYQGLQKALDVLLLILQGDD